MLPLPDDPAVLMEAAREAREPPGCVEVIALVEQTAGLPHLFKSHNAWRLEGQMQGGAWTSLSWTPLGEPEDGVQVRFDVGPWSLPFLPPLFGRFEADEGLFQDASSLLDAFSEMAREEVTMDFAEVDDGQLTLRRVFHDGRRRQNAGAVGFDRATLTPRWWSLVIEQPVRTESLGKLTDLDLHMALDPQGRFDAERFTGQGRAGLLRLRVERDITYEQVQACPSP